MAIYRQLHTTFWKDRRVGEWNKEQKLFFLYLLSNDHTTQCGVYEFNKRYAKFELDVSSKEIDELIDFLVSEGRIVFNEKTEELMIINWLKYNSSRSPKVAAVIDKELREIKTLEFEEEVIRKCKEYGYPIKTEKPKENTLSIGYRYSIDTISQPTPTPTPTPISSKEVQENKTVGGSEIWVDPLSVNKLRTAGLANIKSATFGKVRNGGTRNHQGIDLAADSGTNIFAVCSGIIAVAKDSGGPYGKIVVLEVNIDDLPIQQKKYALKKIINSNFIYFFYAHLSIINVEKGDAVDVTTVLGKTGSSGNASGMTTISKGGHLHFETRSSPLLGKGLQGRFDPIPFFLTKLI